MDFAFTPEQEALRELARRLLEDHVTPDRLAAVEREDDGIDRKTWRALADAKLLGAAVPETFGGSGLGFIELCLVLEQIGRTVAPVPVFPTLVTGALPIATFGTPGQRERWLPRVVAGESMLTAALVDAASDDPVAPTTSARRDGSSRIT